MALNSSLPSLVAPGGEIPLRLKQRPLVELDPAIASSYPLVVERAQGVDISALQQRIQAAGPALWDPATQQDNVPIQRAGHDRWGIGKVVFIFSDDYLQRVYHFPWLHAWHEELSAVFAHLQLPLHRVIRCILASMPPDADIPTHHDTGAWVAQSHRMHLPLFTDPSVSFQVGLREDAMHRVEFKQGHLYELNNACKHSVHNDWSEHRVHLIFDYVDDAALPLPVVPLTPSMVLYQTRRSLDVSSDYGTRVPPSFVVIGAQKAGTTSLYAYLTQHDLVVPTKRKETHYLDWRYNTALPSIDTEEGRQAHRAYYHNFYEMDVLNRCPSLQSGEATPSYLLGGARVIHRLVRLAPACKILAILRNPVDRAYSQYCMTADPHGTPAQRRNRGAQELRGRSFATVIAEERAALQAAGVHPDMSFEAFDTAVLQHCASQMHGGHSFLARGLYALQLAGWLEAFPRHQVRILALEDMKTPESVQETMDGVFDFLDLPPHRMEDSTAKNTRTYEPLEDELRAQLTAFYAPYNEKLFELLGRTLPWNTASSCSVA